MMDEKRIPIISCDHVSKTFYNLAGDHLVVDDLSFNVYENEFVVLFGPGQCGKSTVLNLIAGLELPTGGKITVDGEEVTGPSPNRGMVYQTTNLFMWNTVMQNVEFGPSVRHVPRKKCREIAQKYIDLVGLTGFEKHYPVKLSGGMQKRVGIARAIALNPSYLFCDEPNSGLDPYTSILIDRLISDLTKEFNMTTVVNTHDMNSILEIGDKIGLIYKGSLLWQGDKNTILHTDCRELRDFVCANTLARNIIEGR